MSDFGVAYVSVHPDVIAVYDTARGDEQAYVRRSRRLAKAHLGGANMVRNQHPASNEVLGYALVRARQDHGYLDPRDYDCLPGWRTKKDLVVHAKDGTTLYAEPIPQGAKNGRSQEAKAARELLSQFRPPPNLFKRFTASFAMPGLTLAATQSGGMAIHYPGIEPAKKVRIAKIPGEDETVERVRIYVGAILVFWDVEPSAIVWDATSTDGVRYFRRINLSDYYAALGK